MTRRGLTIVAWVIGLTAVAYEDVVAPIAHAVFAVQVIDETRVGVADPVQIDSFRAHLAKGEIDSPQG